MNEYGTYTGERTCNTEGLTSCNATTPLPETCDNEDNNCDGKTDEGDIPLPKGVCKDKGVCEGMVKSKCSGGKWLCLYDEIPGYEAGDEKSCDNRDNDCDGQIDEGITDIDLSTCKKTGICATGTTTLCNGDNWICVYNFVSGYEEIEISCNDKLDNDCNDKKDCEDTSCSLNNTAFGGYGCTMFYFDGDLDGWGSNNSKCLCAPNYTTKYSALNIPDCNDENASISPGLLEHCGDKLDNDCDGNTDCLDNDCVLDTTAQGGSGCTIFYYDGDGDTYGVNGNSHCLCKANLLKKYTSTQGGDCNDSNISVKPDASEICNDIDDNCDGITDTGIDGYEPNGDSGIAYYLGSVDDSGGWKQVTNASLSPKSDVDWYLYHDNDKPFYTIYPEIKFTSNPGGYTICAYFHCVKGKNDPNYSCENKSGSTWKVTDGPSDAPYGCCGTNHFRVDHNCTDTTDDSVDIFVKIFSTNNTICSLYSLDLGDE